MALLRAQDVIPSAAQLSSWQEGQGSRCSQSHIEMTRAYKEKNNLQKQFFSFNIHVDKRRAHILLLELDDVAGQVCELQHTKGPVGQGNSLGRETLRMNTKLERIMRNADISEILSKNLNPRL